MKHAKQQRRREVINTTKEIINLFDALDQNYVSIRSAAKLTGIGLSTLYKLYRESKIDGATLYNNIIYIPRKWIKENSVPPGYVSISEAAALAHVAVNTIVNHAKAGMLSQIKTTVPIRWSTKFVSITDKKWHTFLEKEKK